jgi:phage terminase Nu1 subunit (DNA packaging protein)
MRDPKNSLSRQFATKRELAALLKVSVRTVSNWMRSEAIFPRIQVGRVVRFDVDEVFEALESFKVGSSHRKQ